ncbi:DNA primase [Methylonatrum kenyense]|uniref:DNA primase n=1 Tax=Methylonatrum kenyense TaxID=455253 RepID=UPI0020BF6B7C|nr:DNA primase [Methylonatrum kenyense]MCK8515402.1 DNA primase [Methylonatrum kenyense]
MAGRIPDAFIDDLLARTDIVELVAARVKLRRSGSNHHGLCPFHNEKTPSFTVSADKQFYHCFGCGAHGTAIRFLMEYDRLSFPEAVELLSRQAGMEIPREARAAAPSPETATLYPLLERAADCYRDWLRRHAGRERAVDYLRKRGLSGEIAARYGIGLAPPGWDNLLGALGDAESLVRAGLAIRNEQGRVYDRFRDRIMFPIRDRRGRTVGFGGRVLDQQEPKYLNSPETPVFQKGRELYGLYECLEQQRKPTEIIVVEGYMDVVALAQHGVPNAVATLGTATTGTHLERIFQVCRDVVFCFDGDRAGREAAWRALENALAVMRDDRQARFLFLPDGEDPDSLIRERGEAGFRALLAEAEPLSEFLFRELSTDADLRTMDGRARLAERGAPLLARVPAGVFRDLLVDELARRAGVDREHVLATMEGRETPARQARPSAKQPLNLPQRRTTVRLAVALLLQRPALAALAGDPARLARLSLPGVPLLVQLLELLRDEPHLSTGAILERFSGDSHETALWKLAAWDHMVPGDGIEEEFTDSIRRLETLLAAERLQYLHERLQDEGLSEDEHAEWLSLLRSRR